jgi:hypothetical protein
MRNTGAAVLVDSPDPQRDPARGARMGRSARLLCPAELTLQSRALLWHGSLLGLRGYVSCSQDLAVFKTTASKSLSCAHSELGRRLAG